MAYSHYHRFSRAQKKLAGQSDALLPVKLSDRSSLQQLAKEIQHQLSLENLQFVERASQHLIDAICSQLNFSDVRIHVLERRPHDEASELHGLYEPVDETRARARIYVWMRTAKRQQVVAYKTYMRTLIHEFCHHLDFEYYQLEDSLHTKGFFQRESDMVRQLIKE